MARRIATAVSRREQDHDRGGVGGVPQDGESCKWTTGTVLIQQAGSAPAAVQRITNAQVDAVRREAEGAPKRANRP